MPGFDDPKYASQSSGLQGLELGAPLGGGSSGGSLPTHSSTTTSSGLNSSSGLNQTGDNYGGSSNSGINQTGDNYSGSAQGYNAKNSTSGEEGIGHGRGGPTAFEADASRVGERDSSKQVTGTPSQQGQGQSNYGSAGVAAGMGAGHHDQALTSGSGAGLTSGEGHHHHHHHSHGQTSSSTGGGVGSELREELSQGHGLTSKSGFTNERDGQVLDSVTGEPHFTTSAVGAGLAGGAIGAGAGAGYEYEQGRSQGQGLDQAQSNSGGLRSKIGMQSSSGGATGPTGELRKELEMHKDGEGLHDVHHAESKGPHGLVFDEATGKYLHRREIDHKGSTGVPLK